MSHLYLDHSIVGQQELTNFELRKDREFACCRICGAIYQSRVALDSGTLEYELNPALKVLVKADTVEWRINHNKTHPDHVHRAFMMSGLFLAPEAAHKLAPYGIAPVSDMVTNPESAIAAYEAPRAPVAEVETS